VKKEFDQKRRVRDIGEKNARSQNVRSAGFGMSFTTTSVHAVRKAVWRAGNRREALKRNWLRHQRPLGGFEPQLHQPGQGGKNKKTGKRKQGVETDLREHHQLQEGEGKGASGNGRLLNHPKGELEGRSRKRGPRRPRLRKKSRTHSFQCLCPKTSPSGGGEDSKGKGTKWLKKELRN